MHKRHCIGLLVLGLLMVAPARAEVGLIGVFPGKAAVLSIDGGSPKTVRAGQSWSGVRVISVEQQEAVVEIDGKRRRLVMGTHSAGDSGGGRARVTLTADPRGHFITQGVVNGSRLRMMVDTGASVVALAAPDARRLGIDYERGTVGSVATANGRTRGWRIKLDTVTLGEITLHNVDAVVVEGGLEITLLGMSFLNRVEMRRDGDRMTLIRRF